jgi:hypothetical protein
MIDRARVNWRRELLYLGLAAMECCWLYPWQTLFLGYRGRTQRIPMVGLLAIMMLALYLTRLFNQSSVSLGVQRTVTLVIALSSTLLLLKLRVYSNYAVTDLSWLSRLAREMADILQRVPVSLIVLLIGLYLWWRGIEIAQKSLSLESVGFSFRLGIIAFLWLYLARVLFFAADALPYPLLYFLVGLIAVGLARVEEVSQSRAGIRSPFNGAWMGILGGSALVVSALSLIAVNLFSFRNIAALLTALRPLAQWIALVTRPLQALVAWLLQLILRFFIDAFSRFLGSSESPESSTWGELDELLQEWQQRPAQSPPLIWTIIQWTAIGLGFLLLLALLALSIGRVRRALQESRSAEHESVWDAESAAKDIRDTVGDRWKRWREELLARLARLRGEEYSLASIRKTYASLARLAAASGYPRQDAETPYEYISALQRAFPASEAEIQLITNAYVRVHYGERSFSPEYVQQVRDAWLKIRERQEETSSHSAPEYAR